MHIFFAFDCKTYCCMTYVRHSKENAPIYMYYVAPETPMMSSVIAYCPDLVPPQYFGQVYASVWWGNKNRRMKMYVGRLLVAEEEKENEMDVGRLLVEEEGKEGEVDVGRRLVEEEEEENEVYVGRRLVEEE